MRNIPLLRRFSRRRFLRNMTGLMALVPMGPLAKTAAKTAPPKTPPSIKAGDFKEALAAVLGGQTLQNSEAIQIEVPQLAENGAIVPMTVESLLPETRRILIFAEKNPGPLLAEFRFEPEADPWASLRVKLNESGPVWVIAEAGGAYYGRQVGVQVMVGGCG